MEATAAISEFVDLFQEFLFINANKEWPKETTTEHDIRDAYSVAVHIERCVAKLQQLGVLDEFLDTTLNSHQAESRPFLRDCLMNPSKIILKKIINSKTSIQKVELGVKLYLEEYSEDMLQTTLENLFVETASKETLKRNLCTELSEGQLVLFQTKVLLSELNTCDHPENVLKDLLNEISHDCLEILVVSSLNEEPKHVSSVKCIVSVLEQTMSSKQLTDKAFWAIFFQIRTQYLQNICRKHEKLFDLICTVLFDVAKLIKQNMSMEFFYIEMSYEDLEYTVRTICDHRQIGPKFIAKAREFSGDPEYWQEFIEEFAF